MEQLKLYLFRRNDRVHRIKIKSKIAVSYFNNRRWQLVTSFEQLCGTWPYQNKLQQYPLQVFYSFITMIAMSATANSLPEYVGVDSNMTIECCLLMLLIFGIFVKFFFASIHQSNRRKFYERIVKNFETMTDPEEAAVLNDGAEIGFIYFVKFISGISLCIVIFVCVPVLQSLYQYSFNHRQLEMQLPLPMNFGFDHSKYWYIVAIDYVGWVCTAAFTDFAYDLSFILQIRHLKALFKIVGMRLRKASELVDEFENENDKGKMSGDAEEQSYSLISSAIDLHSECFEVVKQIEECSTMSWFIILLISTGGVGAGLQLLSSKFHDPIETFRYSAAFMILMLHFQVIFSQGQVVIDSAESVLDTCCELKWYGLPKKSRKLLSVMMMRTSLPCQLTGAKLFYLSMESFSKMLKAGLSYYTVFRTKCT